MASREIESGSSTDERGEPPTGTISSEKPDIGTVRLSPSLTQVYLGPNAKYKDVCNYTFKVVG